MMPLATIVAIDPDIEEQVLLNVNGQLVTAFVAVCPFPIEVGRTYTVTLSLWSAEGLALNAADDVKATAGVFRLGNGFAHHVVGRFDGTRLDAGLVFELPDFAQEYRYLVGSVVSVSVDRIQVAFENDR